jgi:hypothetical protein
MPDALLGFALQSFAPPVQPYAVSSASALMTLEQLLASPRFVLPVAGAEAPRQSRTLRNEEAMGALLAFKALLHTRVHHFMPVV